MSHQLVTGGLGGGGARSVGISGTSATPEGCKYRSFRIARKEMRSERGERDATATERHFTQRFHIPHAWRGEYFVSGRLGLGRRRGQRYDCQADLPHRPVRTAARARGIGGACYEAIVAMARKMKSASAAQMEGNRGFRLKLQQGKGCFLNQTSRVLRVVLMSSGSVKVPDAK